jgi:hypothetical protein
MDLLRLCPEVSFPQQHCSRRWLAPPKPKPTALVFRPVCFKRLLITKKGQGDKKDSAVLIASAESVEGGGLKGEESEARGACTTC